jgi:hypothetical protein
MEIILFEIHACRHRSITTRTRPYTPIPLCSCSTIPFLDTMRVVNHDPSDPYAKPPPSMQNSTLRKRWRKLGAETREAFWKELEDGSTTEPESDEDLVEPRALLHGDKKGKRSLEADDGQNERVSKKIAHSNSTGTGVPEAIISGTSISLERTELIRTHSRSTRRNHRGPRRPVIFE